MMVTKMAQMPIPDSVYNWIVDFFDEHYPEMTKNAFL